MQRSPLMPGGRRGPGAVRPGPCQPSLCKADVSPQQPARGGEAKGLPDRPHFTP